MEFSIKGNLALKALENWFRRPLIEGGFLTPDGKFHSLFKETFSFDS